MKQTFDLSKMELSALSNVEMLEVDGGELLTSWPKVFGIGWVVDQVITNWDEIKAGLKDGYNATI